MASRHVDHGEEGRHVLQVRARHIPGRNCPVDARAQAPAVQRLREWSDGRGRRGRPWPLDATPPQPTRGPGAPCCPRLHGSRRTTHVRERAPARHCGRAGRVYGPGSLSRRTECAGLGSCIGSGMHGLGRGICRRRRTAAWRGRRRPASIRPPPGYRRGFFFAPAASAARHAGPMVKGSRGIPSARSAPSRSASSALINPPLASGTHGRRFLSQNFS